MRPRDLIRRSALVTATAVLVVGAAACQPLTTDSTGAEPKEAAAPRAEMAAAKGIAEFGDAARDDFCRGQLPGLDGTYTTVFNDPHSDNAFTQNRISCYLQSLINETESGEEIAIATYRFLDGDLRHNLWRAAKRGVKVKVLLNGSAKPESSTPRIRWKCGDDSSGDGKYSEQFCELKREIGGNRSRDSWISYCGAGKPDVRDDACIGGYSENYNGSRPIMHNKFYLFSKTMGKKNVVVQTTSNLSDHSGPEMFNSALAIAEKQDVYRVYRSYFDDLAKEDKDDHYYENHNPAPIGRTVEVNFSPRQNGNTPLDYLNRVKCGPNDSGGTGDDNRTIIRVAAADIRGHSGSAIAKKLWKLDDDGCYVDIAADIIGYGKYSDPRTDPLRRLLKQPTDKYHGPVVREFSSYRRGVHEKNILIDGNFDGNKDQKVVLTGSLNFNNKSRYANDEVWMMVINDEVHDEFKQNFWDIRKCANLDWQTSAQQNSGTPTHPHKDCRKKR